MAIQEIQNNEKGFSVRTKLNNMFAELYGFITSIFNTKADKTEVLLKNNTTEYVPTADYHPATKKMVTDAIGAISSSKIKDDANTDWVDTKFIDNQITISSTQRSSNPNILAIRNGTDDKLNVLRDGSIVNTGAFKIGTYNTLNIPTKEERKIIYMTGIPGEFGQEGLHICKNNIWIPIDTYFRRPYSTQDRIYAQTGIKDLRISDNAYGLTQVYLKNTNDTADYAGAVLSLEGSGAEYTNFMSMGKYGALFYITNWRGKGVVASDKNMILSSTNGTTGQIEFEVGGSMSAPTRRFVMENDGTLAALTTNYENLVTSDNDIPNKKYVDNQIATLKAKGYYTATVGIVAGCDYTTHRLAYAAGHKRVIQIGPVTEIASTNFQANDYYEILGVQSTAGSGSRVTWTNNFTYSSQLSGNGWELKLTNINMEHGGTLAAYIAYCSKLILKNCGFRVIKSNAGVRPFSSLPMKIEIDNSTFTVPTYGFSNFILDNTVKSWVRDSIFNYEGSYNDNLNAEIFNLDGADFVCENTVFTGNRFGVNLFNNNIKQFRGAYNAIFRNVTAYDANANFYIENCKLFSGGTGNGANLYNPQTVENLSSKIYVQYNSSNFKFPTLKSVFEVDLYITINQVVSVLGDSSVVDTALNVYIAATALNYGQFSSKLRVENGSFKLYGITTSHNVTLNRVSFCNTYIELIGLFPNLKLVNSTILGGKIATTLNCVDSSNRIECQDSSNISVSGDDNIISSRVNGAITLETGSSYNIVSMSSTSSPIIDSGINNLVSNNLLR